MQNKGTPEGVPGPIPLPLPGGEGELVKVHGIARFVIIAVNLVIDGDPLENISILQDRARFRLIIKDGEIITDTL